MQPIILNRYHWPRRVGLSLVVITLAMVLLSDTTGAIEIIAHRGASDSAPENTLSAVNAAWEQGADAVEVDVHLTADNRIVVIHDPTTTRTTGVVGRVARLTLDGLNRLPIVDFSAPVPSGEKIPTLVEVLETIPEGKRLFIEIKSGNEIVPKLTRVLRASGKQSSQLVAITWRFATARAIKCRMPDIKVYMLRPTIGNPCRHPILQTNRLHRLIRKSKRAGLDGIDVGHTRLLSAASVRYAHQLGMEVFAWTVNSVPAARRMQAMGVDGITTDHPLRMREVFGVEFEVPEVNNVPGTLSLTATP